MDALNLSRLLDDPAAEGPQGLATDVTGIAYRSDQVRRGDAFFCIRGLVHNGHLFAPEAVARGAAVVVVMEIIPDLHVSQVRVADTRRAMADASARFFGEPSKRLDVVGITGTNGKTTTTYLLDAILRASGRTTGSIGTVETRIAERRSPAARTTPESRDLQELLAEMVDAGVDAVAMEVSSHALDLGRVDCVRFAVAAFTNLTQDHLDYHASLEEYFAVKSRLFDGSMPVGVRVVQIDDPHGRALASRVEPEWTVGRSADAVLRAENVCSGPASSRFDLIGPAGSAEVTLPLAGDFNVSNALVAAGCALALGVSLEAVVSGLRAAPQVPGRLERVDEGQPFAMLVDYAHTPDGLEKAIGAVRDVTLGKVITVFGCGGDRDPAKRSLMGRAAGSLSDVVVVTSDNPRSEDPAAIVAAVLQGVAGTTATVFIEPDRREAIALAISLAGPSDAILIAGKGHEDYQIFADRTVHFDDREVAREEVRRAC